VNKENVPYMKKPCGNCPFRKDSAGIKCLGKKRAQEISKQNMTDGFVCHKTVDYSKENGEIDSTRKQCAGALILAKKTKSPQPFLDLYEGMFKVEMELNNKDVIVDTYEEFINIQS
jgi:hypothetical protein